MINTDALTIRGLCVDSRTRVTGTAEDCVIQLKEPVHLPRGAKCWVTQVQVPLCWENVSSLNNQFYVTERTTSLAAEQTYIV